MTSTSETSVEAQAEHEIDILFSTDVLSEGQNLQDCAYLINYDLHWNPTRMIQRAGRIDRIGRLRSLGSPQTRRLGDCDHQ